MTSKSGGKNKDYDANRRRVAWGMFLYYVIRVHTHSQMQSICYGMNVFEGRVGQIPKQESLQKSSSRSKPVGWNKTHRSSWELFNDPVSLKGRKRDSLAPDQY